MDRAIRRTALRNAAKVAFGSLMVGCGGRIDTSEGAPTVEPAHDAAVKPEADAASTTLACTGPVEVDASGVDSSTFECCLDVEQALIGDASPWTLDAGAVLGDPSAQNCCNAIVAHVDQVSSDYTIAVESLHLCCSALQYPIGPACTPWGPPTPPAMLDTTMLEVA